MTDRPDTSALDAWGQQVSPPAPARTRRPAYGRVYELLTGDPRDGEHPYVGQTTTTIANRVKRHKGADELAKRPWKARILDGPRGYRLLETVYSTGDCAEDERALNRAEAFWIDRLRPTHNDVRPVRPPLGQVLPSRPKDSPGRGRGRAVARRPRHRVPFRVWVLVAMMGVGTWLAALLVVAMALPWPAAPWLASPVLGIGGGFATYLKVHAMGRKAKLWR